MKKLLLFLILASAGYILSCAPEAPLTSVNALPTNSYHCGIHPSMLGKIIVTNAGAADVSTITNTVNIQTMAFNPADLTIPRGSWVKWINLDTVPHSVVADDNSFNLPSMNQNGSGALQFN